jgi:hypothetical protein
MSQTDNNSEKIKTVACQFISETEAAFLLEQADRPGRQAWFPKSQVSFQRRNIKTGDAMAEIPAWLLREKGWKA